MFMKCTVVWLTGLRDEGKINICYETVANDCREEVYMRLRDKIANWMIGRNGADQLSRFESGLALVLVLVSLFTRQPYTCYLALVIMVHMYFRVFSTNVGKRYQENQKFLNLRYQAVVKWNKFVTRMKQRKNYRFFKCPTCKQTVRVPKGHGKICITCPKCREEFVKRT